MLYLEFENVLSNRTIADVIALIHNASLILDESFHIGFSFFGCTRAIIYDFDFFRKYFSQLNINAKIVSCDYYRGSFHASLMISKFQNVGELMTSFSPKYVYIFLLPGTTSIELLECAKSTTICSN